MYNDTLNTLYLLLYVIGHIIVKEGRKEGNVLFNDALNTFYLLLYVIGHIIVKEGRKEMFYLTTHSTHCIYCYMSSDILVLRTSQITRQQTRYHHFMDSSFRTLLIN